MEINILRETLKNRFYTHLNRHKGIDFDTYFNALNPKDLETIQSMEITKGEPDLVVIQNRWYVIDMVKETPSERANQCYDFKARISRKKFPPKTSVLETIQEMKAKLLDIELYKSIQDIEDIDLKTSSWLLTSDEVRNLGGALFGEKRYNKTFIFHNGADSYYGVRGYRGYIEISRPKL